MSKDYKDLLGALDIGTSKVVAIVAELKGDGITPERLGSSYLSHAGLGAAA